MEDDTIICHSKFYFKDGDLVIKSAPNADEKPTVFRVNKSVLAFNSTVFAGMLTLPGGSEVHETYDGVPVVAVTDTAEELAALMTALYDPG